MKIAVLSDIHANWSALEAVLNDMPEVDDVLCLGDVVGYGAEPVRCIEEVSGRGWTTLVGNHDHACIETEVLAWFNPDAAEVIRWTRDEIGADRLEWLNQLPESTTRDETLCVHASPRDPTYEYVIDFTSAYANLTLLGDRVCFHGHTHVPGAFSIAGGDVTHRYELGELELAGPQLVNPGSVGQPRDGDPDASYGIWDVGGSTFEFRRVPYDREAAKRAILDAGLPERFAARLDAGR